jgi:transcription initiation factor TFIIIB Brf1 subunit/transcription initiation factor TFIIB
MYSRSAASVPNDACNHTKTINDDREGELICLDCGLVLEKIFENDSVLVVTQMEQTNLKIREFILDVCENACIQKNIAHGAFDYFTKISKKVAVSKFKDVHLASYAIYEMLNRFSSPRTAEEIEFYTGTPVNKLWVIQSHLNFTQTLNNPKDYIERFCSLLDLEFSHLKRVTTIVSELSKNVGCVKSNCLIAAAIRLYCNECKIPRTLKLICNICSISPASVHRLVRCLDDSCIARIALLSKDKCI